MDVADWLRALGLEQYEATFRENGVGAEDLRHLTAEDLRGDSALQQLVIVADCWWQSRDCAPKIRQPVILFDYRPARRSARPATSAYLKPVPNVVPSA